MKTTISQKRARRYNRDVPIELAISAIAMPPSQNCNPAIMYVCLCGQTLDEPPLEEHLCQNTLWPEMHKLYGHGNEVYAVAHTNSHINALLASACKAQSPQAAEIILWDSVKGCEVQRLSGHNLTVTSLAFSPNDEYLVTTTICQSRRTEPVQKAIRMLALVPIDQQVSTSRDRALCLYSRDDKGRYSLSSTVKKAHDRILWSCSFSQALQLGQGQGGSSKGLYVVATGSRDKSLKTWLVDDTSGTACLSLLDTVKQFSVSHSGREGWLAGWLAGLSPALPPQNAAPTTERQQHRRRFGNTRKSHLALSPPLFQDSITAVSYLAAFRDDLLLLAIGSEKGGLEVWSQQLSPAAAAAAGDKPAVSCSSSRLLVLDERIGHTAAVKRIRTRRVGPSSLDIATCSEDGSVRIFEMQAPPATQAR